MLLSLVQTSQNRKFELARFIKSLNDQVGVDNSSIQLIFIDQENNREVLDLLNEKVELTYIPYHLCSLSHARNIGLSYVKGEYIGFPDDDCWYEPDTIKKVIDIFNQKQYKGVCAKGVSEDGISTSTFLNHSTELSIKTFYSAISYTMFFKFESKLRFDENMGIGSSYNIGSGEESDYLLSLMLNFGYKVYFNDTIIVHHPLFITNCKNPSLLKKQFSYARGMGYLYRKHNISGLALAKIFIRPVGGMIVNALKFDLFHVKISYLNIKGRIQGYFFNPLGL
ncbi:glycosyltransferase family 2 protein [Phocaeicola sartorii]|uniref:Glycosyltransferase 2-like domain-containing protein n=1 Tax=Phocaeicola sartorii TaxID=671267 RepID=R9IGY5_9BACT|nr:glycosyltransferase family 2 protein [Phocaeicola sartorii]EOS12803.1 hypothetical protein C802_01958 [Phocaeicola sartorii]MCR1847346.1 glycosyltransferase family 2 protein [Phocaeicola sartorii]NUK98622.1 glycosyltransferase family 2 protein [Phocaeicola sartorii]